MHVCHAGYVSLFPLLLGLLPPSSPHLAPLLAMINDPAQLWSPAGIRSLSKQHALYGQGENYWRGPVWMPMNYLALRSLFRVYARADGPSQARAGETYERLRGAVVENMLKVSEVCGMGSGGWGTVADDAFDKCAGVRADGVRVGAVPCRDGGGAEEPRVHGVELAVCADLGGALLRLVVHLTRVVQTSLSLVPVLLVGHRERGRIIRHWRRRPLGVRLQADYAIQRRLIPSLLVWDWVVWLVRRL